MAKAKEISPKLGHVQLSRARVYRINLNQM